MGLDGLSMHQQYSKCSDHREYMQKKQRENHLIKIDWIIFNSIYQFSQTRPGTAKRCLSALFETWGQKEEEKNACKI